MSYIIQAFRTAVTRAGKGAFRTVRADDLAAAVIRHIMYRMPHIPPGDVDGVIVGCANPEGEQGLQIGRQVALLSLGIDVPGLTVNRYCGSGLEAIAIAAAKIRAGMGDVFIAGGTESMSMIPMTGYKLAPNYNLAETHPEYIVGMGLTAEAVAKKYDISREAADEFSYNSHQKAASAQDEGKFETQIVPVEVKTVEVMEGQRLERTITVSADEGVRRDTSPEILSRLRPVFARDGVVTAGSSSQTSDGAAFALVMSESAIKRYDAKPVARLLSYAVAGVHPLYMGIGPVRAIPLALERAGLKLKDLQQIELNEAFAAQALAVIRETGLDPGIVNVNGGAIALGHPLGCTGAKLTTQLIHEMERREQRIGMVTACVGGGQGVAGIFERL
jgi:acetyl-CoA acyltransferase